ncbi:ATP-dependent helicase [Methanofollis formosanus]|uniref:DNA 3'-5' helicase n=1 Tax=Methanofollis formosanus TaxID=299308 RepID=A0A8G1EG84_9EURY|nr:ATP-dependent DNA helicase [Methanofollis formosanus]QYZ78899.1 ATP-dependent helicase [Methanofollis formosanus]
MDINEVLKNNLTPEQKAAAEDTTKEVICLACAGSGKSRTLAYRIARLLSEGEKPESIVAFTFTDKAAETIKRRVAKALMDVGISTDVMGAMYIGTIHSYCQYILGRIDPVYRQYEVLDDNRLILYLMSRYLELGLKDLRSRACRNRYFETIKQVSNSWKVVNDEMIKIEEVEEHDPELGASLNRLSRCLQRDQYLDFSLMIRKVVDAFDDGNPNALSAVDQLKHLMVDEYQDVSPSQEYLIRHLHRLSETLFVVGDDDQAIYGWRGADVSNIINFQDRFSEASEHTLSENFRSTSSIVEVSNAFISAELGPSRIDKMPHAAHNITPSDIRVIGFSDRKSEATWVAERINSLLGTAYEEPDGEVRGLTFSDFAILMRSTRELENDKSPRHSAFTQALKEHQIQYSLEAGGGPFERPQVNVLRETFRLLRDGSPNRSDVRTYFDNSILLAYPHADFESVVKVLTEWGRQIHTPLEGTRQRIYPQNLVFELLGAFGIAESNFSDEIMRDIGLFSKMIQDIEAVYVSVDSPDRFQSILNFLDNAAETGYDVSTDDIVRRPNTVAVSTVHKVKGLEYPVVFLVDAEAQRFPGNKKKYQGWLPEAIIKNALNRGAYQRNYDEEARLFYTALTRAERYLYVTGAKKLPGGKSERKLSKYALRLKHDEISHDPTQMPKGLISYPQKQKIDEAVLPTSFSEIRYYLHCPMDYRFRKGFGFTPAIPEMFGFGQTVHTCIQKLHTEFTDGIPTSEDAESMVKNTFHLQHVPRSGDPVLKPGPYENAENATVKIAQNYVENNGKDFQTSRQVEARFEIPAEGCVISGSIDLLLKEDPTGTIIGAEVIDFKAMEGKDDPFANEELEWTELALQVQLYAKAARDVLGENARTGSVHLLKDDKRMEVPIFQDAIDAAVMNVEWAVKGILDGDYPMRPHPDKCDKCDFKDLCPKIPQEFRSGAGLPPEIHLINGNRRVLAFSKFEGFQGGD